MRREEDFAIIACTDARAVMGPEEAIARGQSCRKDGADTIFIEALQIVDKVKRVPDAIDAPLLINMVPQSGKMSYVPTDKLERMGYDIIIFASDVQRAAICSMRRLLQKLRAQCTGEFCAATVGFQEREAIMNADYYFQECYLRLISGTEEVWNA